MFSQDNVYAVLSEVIAPGVDEEPLYILHLVVNLAEEPFLVVTGHFRKGRVGTHILLTKVVSLLCPESFQRPDDRLPVINKSYTVFCNLFAESLLNVEAKLLQLLLKDAESNFGLCNVSTVKRIKTINSEDSSLHPLHFPCLHIFNEVAVLFDTSVYFLIEDSQGVVLVALAIAVKVEMEELDLLLKLAVIYLPDILLGQDDLSGLRI